MCRITYNLRVSREAVMKAWFHADGYLAHDLHQPLSLLLAADYYKEPRLIVDRRRGIHARIQNVR